MIGDALLLLNEPAAAKPHYEALDVDDPFRLARLALVAAREGDREGAERTVAQLKQQAGASASYQYGEIYAELGDKDRAFAEFDNAISAKDSGLIYLKVDPFVDPIRSDSRYAALLRRLNFP
jgi:tetratricopeptide (TPR) repeat protein